VARHALIGLLLLALFAMAAVAGSGSAAGDAYSRKQSIDAQLAQLQAKIAAARAQESSLQSQITGVGSELQGLNTQVQDVSSRLLVLERDLELHREKLARLTELFRVETRRLAFLRAQYDLAVRRLDRRLVAIYQSEDVGALEVVLATSSFSEMLDRLEDIRQVGAEDRAIAETVERAKVAMRIARAKTRRTKVAVAAATRSLAVRTAEVRSLRDQLLARRSALAAARIAKQASLSSTRSSTAAMLDEEQGLQQTSSGLEAQIRAAEAAAASSSSSSGSSSGYSPGAPSSSGLIWPVSGPVVSPFGYRCLGGICRLHEGIDIGVGYGTPIHAAAAGTVIVAGWEDGYGNILVVDHGGGLATAYAHQSGFAVGAGAHVSQGQVIGFVGCTGRCFGPHLHFEVRVNGQAVDPLGYL
jgi:murein DD-endopeptidase MepM/ murein hydrolase activator NlpD